MDIDPRITTFLGAVKEMRPAHNPLTQIFFNGTAPIRSGTTKIALDKIFEDEGLAPLVQWQQDGVSLGRTASAFESFEPAYTQMDEPLDIKSLFEPIPGEDPLRPLSVQARKQYYQLQEAQVRENRRTRLVEWMSAQSIVGAQINLVSPAFPNRLLDFGRDPLNTLSLPATELWTATTSSPLRLFEDTRDLIADKDGHDLSGVLLGGSAWNALWRHGELEGERTVHRASNILDEPLLKSKGKGFKRMMKLGDFEIYVSNHTYEDNQKVRRKYIASDQMVMFDLESYKGRTAYGAIMHEDAGFKYTGEMFHLNYKAAGAKASSMYSASAPLVFPTWANATVSAKVV